MLSDACRDARVPTLLIDVVVVAGTRTQTPVLVLATIADRVAMASCYESTYIETAVTVTV